MNINLISLVILVIFACVLYSIYVQVIKKKNKVQEAFASIDVQLKKRYDLIPNILAIANKFMEHERGLIEDVTRLRTEALKLQSDFSSMKNKIKLENELQSKLGQLMVSVENYPQLKSNETMVQAMQTFAEMEEQISAARRFYNAAILDLNNAVEIFPSSIFASSMGLTTLPFFEIADEKEKAPIDAKTYLYK
ncbi:MAG: LemA family protein [Candidatus Gastranaerophilaceae bacterium]